MTVTIVPVTSAGQRKRTPWIAIAVLTATAVATIAPGVLAPSDPLAENVSERLQAPSVSHLFGTDDLGRDLLSRVIHGAQASLSTSLLALVFAFTLSLVVGLVAGYVGGFVDRSLMAVVDVLLALPAILISLLIVSGLGRGAVPLAIAVGIASVPVFARLTRAEVLRVTSEVYVEAARGFGLPAGRILLRHVLPGVGGPLAALAALELATIVLSISALSFLGYGVQPPQPEWGNLIAEGRDHFATAWWLTALPGLVLAAVVVSVHRVGRRLGVRDGGVL